MHINVVDFCNFVQVTIDLNIKKTNKNEIIEPNTPLTEQYFFLYNIFILLVL